MNQANKIKQQKKTTILKNDCPQNIKTHQKKNFAQLKCVKWLIHAENSLLHGWRKFTISFYREQSLKIGDKYFFGFIFHDNTRRV